MSKAIVNMTPNPSDIQTIHCSQGDTEAREWEFELHNNGEVIDAGGITEQMVFKSYKGGTEQILPENGAVPVTAPFVGDIKYPDATRNDQEFLYRQSPTEEDGNAKIKKLYGNTLVWNQLVQNGNLESASNWATGNATLSVASNKATLTVTNNGTVPFYQTINQKTAGHTVLVLFNAYASRSLDITVNWGIQLGPAITLTTSNQRFSVLITLRSGGNNNFNLSAVAQTGDVINYSNICLFDLTQMFGSGNEPTTVEEFTSLFSKPYYDYCQGAMLSFGGRNVKFNQLVQNGNFADTSRWSSVGSATINSVSNNTINVTTSATAQSGISNANITMVQNHKYLLVGTIKTTGQTYISISGVGTVLFNTNSFTTKSNIFTWTSSSGAWACMIRNWDTNSATFEAKNIMLFDLTEMFGAGNEPSTSGFKELFPNDYYEYNVGQYMNFGQPVSLKTTGKNICKRGSNNIYNDGNLIPVKNGDELWVYGEWTYTSSPSMYGRIFSNRDEINKNGTGITISNNSFNSGVVKKMTMNADGWFGICYNAGIATYNVSKMMISYVAFTADEYEAYTESTLPIPLDEFPDGMDGINDARDYKNEKGYAKRIGRTDLGTLNWTYASDSGHLRFFSDPLTGIKVPSSGSSLPNITCSRYEAVNEGQAYNNQKVGCSITSIGRVMIYDPSFTDATSFKTAMSGVYLYYELATPLENYGVVDLGTLTYTIDAGNTLYAPVTGLKGVGQSEMPNILCALFTSIKYSDRGSVSYPNISITSDLNIRFGRTGYTDVNAFKQSMQGVYLLYEKANPQGFTTATLVTENGEVALANENDVLVGKCNSDVSADAGFIEGKIKLSNEDGDVYSNKIQIHVERMPE